MDAQLQEAKNNFLQVLLHKGALKIAESEDKFFTLKSGRRSPVFVNFGLLNDGESLHAIKQAYSAAASHALKAGTFTEFDYVFGPAYKGINLAALTCEGLHELHSKNCFCIFDRKEEKAHGEGTSNNAEKVIVGASSWKEGSGMLLVDDLIVTGKAKYDALEKIALLPGAKISGLLLGIDRQEKAGDAINIEHDSAVQAFEKHSGVKTYAILTMKEIFEQVREKISPQTRRQWAEYAQKYCVVNFE